MVIRTSSNEKNAVNFTKISGLLILMETYYSFEKYRREHPTELTNVDRVENITGYVKGIVGLGMLLLG